MPKKFFDITPSKKFPSQKTQKVEPKEIIRQEQKKEIRKADLRPKRTFLKGFVFTLLLLVLIGGVGYSFFSKTKIKVWPDVENLKLEEIITIDIEAQASNFEAKIIPGKFFESQKSNSQDFSATDTVLKEEKAKGQIRVYNAYSTYSQGLLPQTRFVSADGKLFRSLKREVIPGGKYEEGKLTPGYIDIEVQAAGPGEDYNIEPSTFSIPGFAGTPKYTAFYGKSFTPMEGGFKGEVSQVSQEDFERAKEVLTNSLQKESKDFLKSTVSTDFVLLDEAISQEILEINSSPEPGEVAESFSLQLEIKSKGLGLRKSDIENFAKYLINLSVPEDKKLHEESLKINYSFKPLSLADEEATEKEAESGKLIIGLEIEAKVFADIDVIKLKKALSGRPFKEAKIFLEDQPQVNKIEISSWPFWRRRVPEDLSKIEIELNLD